MASPRHNPFCARCGITQLLHAYPETSCEEYVSPGSKEARELEATKAEPIVIDSGVIDNRLVNAANEWLQAKIAKATLHLRFGFSLPKGDPRRDRQFDKALKALGGLGAS
jgi:hypothetical protein